MKIDPVTNPIDSVNYDVINPPITAAYFVDQTESSPALPKIKAGTKVDDVQKNGIWQHACLAEFLDEDNNGIIDEDEAFKIETTQVFFSDNEQSLIIQPVNSAAQIFDDLSIPRSDEYYASGNIHVAVVDSFKDGKTHGTIVSNILKKYNPDIAVTQYEYDNDIIVTYTANTTHSCIDCHGGRSRKETVISMKINSLAPLKQDIFLGIKKYDAINMSVAYSMTYDTINELCYDELKVKLTPENIAQYKSQIKEILNKKCKENPNLKYEDTQTNKEAFLANTLEEIAILDSINIPIYLSQAYKTDDFTKETFNLLSLANTALTIESGTQIVRPYSSSNSFSIDEKTGEKRIAQGIVFTGSHIDKNSTSYATPAFLAKTLKKQ